MSTGWGGRHRVTRGGPPSARRNGESAAERRAWWAALCASGWAALSTRVGAQLRLVRDDWAGVSPWVRARRLVLPALLGWGPALLGWGIAGDLGGHRWRDAAVGLVVAVALLARFTQPAAALLLVVALAAVPAGVRSRWCR